MPRKPRILSSTGIYHTVLRSVNQHLIFEEDSDYHKFLFILNDCRKKYNIEIYAYCVMDNHIHLLMQAPPDNLASFFQSLGTRFVQWYNNKYSRSGHLFQDRYFSQAIEHEASFLSAIVYIHNNPVKANICRYPSEYRFSSFNAYYNEKNPLVNISVACNIAGTRENLLHYFAITPASDQDNPLLDDKEEKKYFTTDEAALQIFKEVTQVNSISEICNIQKVQRNKFIRELKERGLTFNQIARLMDISKRTVYRLCKMSPTPRPQVTSSLYNPSLLQKK